jgi:hypothetical protein
MTKIFVQAAPALGNQFSDDAFLRDTQVLADIHPEDPAALAQ